ncbi:FeoB-associated Cys-rich membrane protein [Aestuariibaculum suncheonense]|uniref:FeoB-associated Cys-rich membrane protein n=1 Tax=Aestuariibaculum suncheonense TaxID=1028745 RepID=A0A8J6QD88_9FLAO|nr:FeoB-associated Cys-rich membrane protein [Aestuariibaculum suncheonense]MBD0833916.1 FeoB-associated Cys-rich membrane protein [Aestuariibaculum suncheonense]
MNTLIQNILVFSAVALALLYLIRKFFWKKKKSKKACGEDNCGCH